MCQCWRCASAGRLWRNQEWFCPRRIKPDLVPRRSQGPCWASRETQTGRRASALKGKMSKLGQTNCRGKKETDKDECGRWNVTKCVNTGSDKDLKNLVLRILKLHSLVCTYLHLFSKHYFCYICLELRKRLFIFEAVRPAITPTQVLHEVIFFPALNTFCAQNELVK